MHAGDDSDCVLRIEIRRAVENFARSCRVEGVGCMIIAPLDLSTEPGGVALSREQTHAMRTRGDTIPVQRIDTRMLAGLARQTKEWRGTAPARVQH